MSRMCQINADSMLARLWWKYRKVFLILMCCGSFLTLAFYRSNFNTHQYPSASPEKSSSRSKFSSFRPVNHLNASKPPPNRYYLESGFYPVVKNNHKAYVKGKANINLSLSNLNNHSQENGREIPIRHETQEVDHCPSFCAMKSLKRNSSKSIRNTQRIQSTSNSMKFESPFKHRLVHLDLKGAPPKVSYIEKILPILQRSGATGILLEYEDMFPYNGTLRTIAASNAYTPKEVIRILRAADALNLVVIPLIQTFGHLEFVLKLPQFQHLREDNTSAAALCPLNPQSFTLVTEMIDQIMSLHQRAKYIHVGCDEVFQMGLCKKCNKYQYKKDVLYLEHVTKVAWYVKKTYNITPIIWDDMLRRTSSRILKSFDIGSLVEIMIWVYAEDVPSLFFPRMWNRYNMVFNNVWVASAYKGAFGRELVVPNVKRHLNNHVSWLSVMNNRSSSRKTHIQGLALTGWQRYEHFGPLCELLPVGLPSLILNLLTVAHGFYDINMLTKLRQILNCVPENRFSQSIDSDPYLEVTMEDCSFPGSMLFRSAQKFRLLNDSLSQSVTEICDSVTNKTFFCRDHHKYLPQLQKCRSEIEHFSTEIKPSLANVYDEEVSVEWAEQNINPLFNQQMLLETFWKNNTVFISSCKNSYWSIRHRRIFPVLPNQKTDFERSKYE